MTTPIIEAHDLTKIYPLAAGGPGGPGGHGGPPGGPRGPGGATATAAPPRTLTAVDHVELSIQPGEIYGLLGPNGAGKSTTIGMLTTRVTPTQGSIRIGPVDLIARPALAKQLIGVVPQSNTLDRAMTVFENLEFHGRYFGMPGRQARQVAAQLLERVRLADRAKAPVLALSGGMAQRLMVARAIMHRPQILFLDEPTAGLDPQSRLALWDILDELHADGQTILLTTHYMDEADKLCDRLAVMDHGRILALDTPAALKKSVGAGRVITVKASGDATDVATHLTGATIAGVIEVRVVDGRLLVQVDAAADGVLARLIDAVERSGHTVHDLSISEPTLESVFINLTGRDLRE